MFFAMEVSLDCISVRVFYTDDERAAWISEYPDARFTLAEGEIGKEIKRAETFRRFLCDEMEWYVSLRK